MSVANSGGIISNFSTYLEISEPGLRLILSLLSIYGLAFAYRKHLYGRPANLQHLYFIACSLCLGYFNYGTDVFHSFFAIFVTYCTLSVFGGTETSIGIVFVFNMTYLLLSYYFVGTDSYDINWTTPQCVLVLRLIAVSFDVYDGQQPEETLGEANRKLAVTKVPSVLEFFGHQAFPGTFLVGPQFNMRRYQDFVAGEFGDKNQPLQPPNSEMAALKRFGLGVFYMSVFQVLSFFVSDDYMISEAYRDLWFPQKMILLGFWGRYTLYKYIFCWLLAEGACILFGVAHNGVDEEGNVVWDGLKNVKLSLFENTLEFTHYIQSFNVNTNNWVAHYIYKRLKFLGNRQISQAASLAFLAVWHGLHSGYYVCFLLEFLVVYMERDIKSIVNSNVVLSNISENPTFQVVWKLVLRLYTFIFMGFCLLPFVLLKFDRYWYAFVSINYSGLILFVLWPVIYGPLLHAIIPKNKKSRKD